MKIRTQNYNDVAVVELQGELDSDSIELFQNTITDIIAAHKTGIVLDMSDVDFIGSRSRCSNPAHITIVPILHCQ